MKKTPPHPPFLRLVGSDTHEDVHNGIWKDGDAFIVNRHAVLPDYCLKCGKESGGWTRKKTLFWHSPLWFSALLLPGFGILLYLALASMVKKRIDLHIPLCAHHSRIYKLGTQVSLLLIPAFPVLLIAGIVEEQAALVVTGIFSSLAGFALLVWARNPIWPSHINEETARIRGAHSSWLERLPLWRRAS